ncbi:hypothetical protein [Henriciella litoralis]|uniref:hypothetical protein n=1 Tax=Henriciella litoralis TaxID=568102 RepID=UPI000A041F4F|nr:hypothetical protein [Henriciella litoralis]
MTLIHTYIWAFLAAALLVGFVIAWIIQGMRPSKTEQRALMDRDVAFHERDQARSELDSLFEAQRRQKAAAKAAGAVADPALAEKHAKTVAELEAAKDALQKANGELESLRADASRPAPAEPAAAKPAPARDREADTVRNALIARNQYLEDRIHTVELKLHSVAKSRTQASDAPRAEAPVAAVAKEGPAPDVIQQKQAWQTNYLKLRVESLQEKLLELGLAEPEEDSALSDAGDDSSVQQDLARLRWRNRYLEGRLAYFEETPELGEADTPQPQPEPVVAAPAPAEEKVASTPVSFSRERNGPRFGPIGDADGPSVFSALAAAGSSADEASSSQPETERAPASVADGVTRPVSLPSPNGRADDLTRISGVSARLQRMLNDLGIWHLSQIADWDEGQARWVDEELNLGGRPLQDDWIGQARVLS